MPDNPRRSARLLGLIEHALAPERLLSNVYLVSQIVQGSRIRIDHFLTIRQISRLNPTLDELFESCSKSKQFCVVASLEGRFIVMRYPVLQNVLILRGAGVKATVFQIGAFLGRLGGGYRFVLYPTMTGYDFAVNFEKPEACVTLWRALLIVPFEGKLLSVTAYSPILLYRRTPEISEKAATPIVQVKLRARSVAEPRISITRRAERRALQIS